MEFGDIHVAYRDFGGQMVSFQSPRGPFMEAQLSVHPYEMQLRHDIPQLLRLQADVLDGSYTLSFLLRGKQMYSRWLQQNGLHDESLRRLFKALRSLHTVSLHYMLTLESFVYHPDYIYVDESDEQLYFIHLPLRFGRSPELPELMRQLLQRLKPFVDERMSERFEQLDVHLDERPFGLHAFLRAVNRMTPTPAPLTAAKLADPISESKGSWLNWLGGLWRERSPIKNAAIAEQNESEGDLLEAEPAPFSSERMHRTQLLSIADTHQEPQTEVETDIPYLIDQVAGNTHQMKGEKMLIGRAEALVDVLVSEPSVSRLHAEIVSEDGQLLIRDLGSRNGTTHNQAVLLPFMPVPIANGDVVGIGTKEFLFYSSGR